MRRNLAPRLIALAVVAVLGVYYIVFDVMQYRVGAQPFAVTVVTPSAGGLYTGADVTYRGVQVGTVSALRLRPQDVEVSLAIDPGQRIPDNGAVRVKELSALGEQYVDLQPARAGGPYLHQGTVIPARRVLLPTPIGPTLIDLGRLLRSIDPRDLQTDEDFLASAFTGTGPDLRTIVVTGQQLFDALVRAQPETVNLVVDGQKDLATLEATDGDLATFAQGLASVTGALAGANGQLEALIGNARAAESQLSPLLSANAPAIAGAITDLSTAAGVGGRYQPQVQAIFALLPMVSNDLAAVAAGGQVHGELEVNTADTVCPYVLGSQMPGPTQPVGTAALSNGCGTTAPDMLQRGAGTTPTFTGAGG
jgi:phospholipid/cholesterol/gamma-HCH transport system substrate-binding protein